MGINILIEKKHLYYLIGFLSILSLIIFTRAAYVGHTADEVSSGTFAEGNYSFPDDSKVGIGTNNPQTSLHIAGQGGPVASITDGILRFDNAYDNNGNTTANKIVLWDNGSLKFGLGISSGDLDLFSGGNIRFYTSHKGEWGQGNEGLSILSTRNVIVPNGYLGIGTVNPQMNLHIHDGTWQGAIQLTGAGNEQDTYSALYLGDDDYPVDNSWVVGHKRATGQPDEDALVISYFDPSNVKWDYMTIQSDGDVGIGTTDPGERLEIANNEAIKLGHAYISSGGDLAHLATNEWYDGSSWQQTAAGALIQISGQETRFYRHDGAGNHARSMTIDSNGDVGIGDVSNGKELFVKGSVEIDGGSIYSHMNLAGFAAAIENTFMVGGHGLGIQAGHSADPNNVGLMISEDSPTGVVVTHVLYSNGEALHSSLTNGPVCAAGSKLTMVCPPSSINYKTNIKPLELEAEKILNLELKSFKWKDNNEEDFGYIAEEVKEVLPELYQDDGKTIGYSKDKLTFYIIELLKEQQADIEKLNQENVLLRESLCQIEPGLEICKNN